MTPLLTFTIFVFAAACVLSRPAWARAYTLRAKNLDAYFDMSRSHAFDLREGLEQWECRTIGRQPDWALWAGVVVGGCAAALGLAWAALLLASILPAALGFATLYREQAAWNYLRRVPRCR